MRATSTALMTLALLASACTGGPSGATESQAAETTAPAAPEASTSEVSPEPDDQTPEPGGPPLFDGYGTFGVAFDVLNTQLHEATDLERLDITRFTAELPTQGGPGAFVIPMEGAGLVGGSVDAEGSVSSVIAVSEPDSPGGESARRTLMAITVEPTAANIDAFNSALTEIGAAEPGAARYLTLGERGVLLEIVDDDGVESLSLMISQPVDESDAAGSAADLRLAMKDRLG